MPTAAQRQSKLLKNWLGCLCMTWQLPPCTLISYPVPWCPTYDSVMNIQRPQCPVLSWFLVRCSFCLACPASLCPLKIYTCPQPVLGKYLVSESMNLHGAETRTVQGLMGETQHVSSLPFALLCGVGHRTRERSQVRVADCLSGHCTGFHSAFDSAVVFLLSSFYPALHISGFRCHSFHLYLRVACGSYLSFAGAVESSELESGVILESSSG